MTKRGREVLHHRATWPEMRLGEVIELKRGYDLPTSAREPGPHPVVSSSGMTGTHAESKVSAPGVVTGRYGTIGQVFYLDRDFWPLNTTLYVRDFKGNDPQFVSYFLRTLDFHQFSDKAAVPGVNRNHVHEALVRFPPIEEQRAIASVLGALDDKIELNRRMNETLEALARAIFTSWFVDFDPVRAKAEGRQPVGMDAETAALFPDSFTDSPLGPIPTGWAMGTLATITTLSRGTMLPGDFPEEVFEHFSIPAYDDGREAREEMGQSIRSAKFVVPHGAVLLSKLNPRISRVWLAAPRRKSRAIASTEFLVLVPREPIYREWLYCLFHADAFRNHLRGRVTGTSGSHQRVRPEEVSAMDAILPPRPLIAAFARVAQPIFERGTAGGAEARTLGAARDLLLPKLVSGEVRVARS